MATAAGEAAAAPSSARHSHTVTQLIDRWIYVIMTASFIVTVLVGFIPTSIGKIMATQAGLRPPFPGVLHVHAVLMGSWLLLLLAQTSLVATGRRTFHQQLGVLGMLLAPAMVVTGFVLVPTMHRFNWPLIALAPPELLPFGVEGTRNFLSNLVAVQIMAGVLFALLVAWAMLVRRTDSGMHKRLMILATALPLGAAIDRMSWLPGTLPESPISMLGWPVVWVMPMFLWDLARQRRVHRAYVAWAALYAPAAIAVWKVWSSPDWIAVVQRLVGVA